MSYRTQRHVRVFHFNQKTGMPRFFDDYSHTYLTHDSAAGRKQQRRGWKFRENFKAHVRMKEREKMFDDHGST
jgi:hypothetical protein